MNTATKLHTPVLDKYFGSYRNHIPDQRFNSNLSIEKCVQFLASECDGAVLLDHKGFGSTDAPLGHEIAAKIDAGLSLSRSERLECLRYMSEYRGQLVRKFGGQSIDNLTRKRERGFESAIANSSKQVRIPYLAYSWKMEKAVLTLPIIPPGDRFAFDQELKAVVKANGPTIRDAETLDGKYWPLNWESPKVAFRMSDEGMKNLVASLAKRGVLVDQRITKELNRDVAAKIWARPLLRGKDDRFPILFCGIQAKKDLDVRRLAEDFVSSFGIPNIYVKWDNDRKIAMFPIGDLMKERLFELCALNRIAGIKDVIEEIDDPKNAKAQRRELRASVDYTPSFPKPPRQ